MEQGDEIDLTVTKGGGKAKQKDVDRFLNAVEIFMCYQEFYGVKLLATDSKVICISSPRQAPVQEKGIELNELESMVTSIQGWGGGEIQLSNHEKVIDVNKFIDAHYSIIKLNNSKKWISPYIDRVRLIFNITALSRRK